MKGKDTYTFAAKALILFTFLLASAGANAQVSMRLGVTGGPQITNLSSNIGAYKSKMGVNGGAFGELWIGSYLTTRLEALYSIMGAGRDYDDQLLLPTSTDAASYTTINYNYNTTENLTYGQFNLLVQGNLPIKRKRVLPYDLNREGGFYFSAFAGPYYAMLTNHVRSGTIEYTEIGPAPYNDTALTMSIPAGQPERQTQGVFPADIGVVAGIGANYSFGAVTLGLNGRYQMGFNPIDDGTFGKEVVDYTTEPGNPLIKYDYADIFNSAMGVNLSLSFRLF